MLIAVDIDDVMAQSIKRWLELYRFEFDHGLYPEHITHWEIAEFTAPECGRNIYKYLDNIDFYDDVEEVPGAIGSVCLLRELGHRVIFVTSTSVWDNGRKFQWLMNQGLLDGSRESQKDYQENRDKSNTLRADVLIDDFHKNLENFRGHRILFDTYHNQNVPAHHYDSRAHNWQEVVESVQRYEFMLTWSHDIGR